MCDILPWINNRVVLVSSEPESFKNTSANIQSYSENQILAHITNVNDGTENEHLFGGL